MFQLWLKDYQKIESKASDVKCKIAPAPFLYCRAGDKVCAEDIADTMLDVDDAAHSWQMMTCGFFFSNSHLQDAFVLTQALLAYQLAMIVNYTSDMENLLIKCARHVWKWKKFFLASAKSTEFDDTLRKAIIDGNQLLILDVDPLAIEERHNLLFCLFLWRSVGDNGFIRGGPSVSNEDQEILISFGKVHPEFRVILVTACPMSQYGETLMSAMPFIDARLHCSEIADIILDRLWSTEGGQLFPLKEAIHAYKLAWDERTKLQLQLTDLMTNVATTAQIYAR